MPPKDPDKRRAYQRAWKREQRAAKKLEELTGGKRKPPPSAPGPARKPTKPVPVPSLGALAELSYEQWTAAKGQLGAEMIAKARLFLAELEPERMNVADAVKLVEQGARLVEASLGGQKAPGEGGVSVRVLVERLDTQAIDVVHRLLDAQNG